MLKSENTPTRLRTVLEDIYTSAGQEGFQFTIPQPFTAEHVENVTELGASPVGVANQLNQVLAENLSNNIAARVRAASKAGQPLPTQSDMDSLYEAYDFSGTRASSGGVSGSLLDRIFARLATAFLKKLLKKKGYQSQPAPVTVAKKDAEPAPGQISYEQFEVEVARLVEGEGPWAEVPAFIEVRDELISDAKAEEIAIREREVEAENKLSGLGL
jgi:hypothetical protein